MAEGRPIKKKIVRDERVAQLTPDSQLLYTYAILLFDNEGRMPGEPAAVRALAAPLLPWSDDHVDALIAEWTRTTRTLSGTHEVHPLVVRYPTEPPCRWRDKELQLEFECRLALQFAGLHNQPLRFRRGARSSLPPPGADLAQLVLMAEVSHVDQVSQPSQVSHTIAKSNGPSKESARARGQEGFKALPLVSGFEVQDLAAAAASRASAQDPAHDTIGWIRSEFALVFGRSSPEPVGPRRAELAAVVAAVGADRVTALMAERAAAGADPKSVVWFLPALAEMAPVVVGRPVARPPVEVCAECGIGAGLHASGCVLAPPPDESAELARRAMVELGADQVLRQVPAA